MKKTIIATILASLTASCSMAQEIPAAPVQQETVEQSAVNGSDPEADTSNPPPTVSEILEDEYNAWVKEASAKTKAACERMGRDPRSRVCDLRRNIISGDAIVSVSKNNPRWVEARQLAFSSAMSKAYKEYATAQGLNAQVRVISRMLVDDNQIEAPSKTIQAESFEEGTPSKFSQLLNKAFALGEGWLDKKLKELKVDPAKYEGKPIEVKKRMFEDSIKQMSEKYAFAQTSGMVPIQSFFGQDSDGNYGVRVVFTTSPNRIRTVREMLQLGANIPPNEQHAASTTLDDRFCLSGEEMFDMMGTRLVYDEKGYPTLIAFGQAGVAVPRNHPTFAHRQQVAKARAYSNATDALTLLLSSSTSVETKSNSGSEKTTDQAATMDAKGNTSYSEINDETAKIFFDEKIDTSGRISNFEGIKTLHSWSYYDKDSKKYVVGSVVIWSPDTAMEVREQKQALTAPANASSSYESKDAPTQHKAKSKRAKETDNYVF